VQHINHLLDLTVTTSCQGKAMSYAITYSRAYVGVETHLSSGLPELTIVGINNPHDFTKPETNEKIS
jgi:hypothetical protein